MRELSRILGKVPGVFQKDLNKLEEAGILNSYRENNRRFFVLNQKQPIFKELKSIFFKTTGARGLLREELKKIKGVEEAFIYGSFARDEETGLSDVDILVIGSAEENSLLDLISQLEAKLEREINYTLLTRKEFEKKLKEKNSFLENILIQKKIKLL